MSVRILEKGIFLFQTFGDGVKSIFICQENTFQYIINLNVSENTFKCVKQYFRFWVKRAKKYPEKPPVYCRLWSRKQPHTWRKKRLLIPVPVPRKGTFSTDTVSMVFVSCDENEKGINIAAMTNIYQETYWLSSPGSAISWLWLVRGRCKFNFKIFPWFEIFRFVNWPTGSLTNWHFTWWPASSEKERSVSDIHLKKKKIIKFHLI